MTGAIFGAILVFGIAIYSRLGGLRQEIVNLRHDFEILRQEHVHLRNRINGVEGPVVRRLPRELTGM